MQYEVRVLLDNTYMVRLITAGDVPEAIETFYTWLKSIGWENKEYRIISVVPH